tara:strand:- start:4452 stop:5381 length:930 start_codon:yes stop_codon:yes gene_type:complete
MRHSSKIFVAGGSGMVGSSIIRALKKRNFENLIYPSSKELDLSNQEEVKIFFESNKIDYVFLAAARVGGILENTSKKGEFIYINSMIQNNVIHNAYKSGVKKLLFLGSSCIYPKISNIPIDENELLSGKLEPTNDAYAIAKIAGIKMCEAYKDQYGFNAIAMMPTNLYGPGDNFDPSSSHVIPGLIRKFSDAKMNKEPHVICWGTGSPRREFLYVDDLADAAIFMMENYEGKQHINVGTGEDITIKELSEKIRDAVEFEGDIIWDATKPDGTKRKLLNSSMINNLGWKYSINLDMGLEKTLQWYKINYK